MTSPYEPRWCDACQSRAAERSSRWCAMCKADWHNAQPAAGMCVHCRETAVEPGDVYCWYCNEELMSAAFGGDAPTCND